jgi:hypothetical protein
MNVDPGTNGKQRRTEDGRSREPGRVRGDGGGRGAATRTGQQQPRTDSFEATVEAERQSRADLLAELGLLTEENRRLRASSDRDRRRSFRRAAIAVGLLGVVAAAAGVVIPTEATVLFALAGVGLFTAALTYFLTPESVITAPVSERVYAALAHSGDAVRADLGLHDASVYLPVDPDDAPAGAAPVRLFVPQHDEYDTPLPDEAARAFVVSDDDRRRGVSFVPTGATLLSAFEAGDESVHRLNLADYVARVADTLVDGFELVAYAAAELDSEAGVLTVGIRRSALGPVDRFDHPVGSFVAAALARRLDVPVTLETTPADDGRVEYYLTCRWTPDADADEDEDANAGAPQ